MSVSACLLGFFWDAVRGARELHKRPHPLRPSNAPTNWVRARVIIDTPAGVSYRTRTRARWLNLGSHVLFIVIGVLDIGA